MIKIIDRAPVVILYQDNQILVLGYQNGEIERHTILPTQNRIEAAPSAGKEKHYLFSLVTPNPEYIGILPQHLPDYEEVELHQIAPGVDAGFSKHTQKWVVRKNE